jgi:large subunit ribosomal protein L9e
MKQILSKVAIDIPKGIELTVDSRRVTVTKSGVTLKRDFRHLPVMIKKVDGGKKVEVSLYFGLSKQRSALRTVCSHIDNMIVGVTQKFRYCMRLVYAHFPINATITNGGKTLEVRNFLGEKIVRTIDMLGDNKN